MFHDDHIIPMKLILEQLLNLENPTSKVVREIVENICLCRMLKTEDRRVKERHNRPFDKRYIVEELYSQYGIYLKDYNYTLINPFDVYDFDKPINLRIPKSIIKSYRPALDDCGGEFAILLNDMATDIYKDDKGDVFSTTNDNELIHYVITQTELRQGD